MPKKWIKMGNKNKKGNKVKIMTDKPRNVDTPLLMTARLNSMHLQITTCPENQKGSKKKISLILLEDIQILQIVYVLNPAN